MGKLIQRLDRGAEEVVATRGADPLSQEEVSLQDPWHTEDAQVIALRDDRIVACQRIVVSCGGWFVGSIRPCLLQELELLPNRALVAEKEKAAIIRNGRIRAFGSVIRSVGAIRSPERNAASQDTPAVGFLAPGLLL